MVNVLFKCMSQHQKYTLVLTLQVVEQIYQCHKN